MALHLSGEGMDGEQRINALEIRAGSKEHGVAAARRVRVAGGHQRAEEKPGRVGSTANFILTTVAVASFTRTQLAAPAPTRGGEQKPFRALVCA